MVSGDMLVVLAVLPMPICKLDKHLAASVKYLPVGMMASRGIVAFIGGGRNSEQCLPSF
jgi:hypothetical protein